MNIKTININIYFVFILLLFLTSCIGAVDKRNIYRRTNNSNFAFNSSEEISVSYDKKKYKGKYKVGSPYKINGKKYIPKKVTSYKEIGVASWYGEDFHNKKTANGDIFDMNAMTAAHKTLLLPSIVKVTNLENGKSTKLVVNDRGPFVNERLIDVSKKAAEVLGFKKEGITKVKVEFLKNETEKFLEKNNIKH